MINNLFSLHLLVKDESQKHFSSFLSNETKSSNDSNSPKKYLINPDISHYFKEEHSLENQVNDFEKLKNIEEKYSKVIFRGKNNNIDQ